MRRLLNLIRKAEYSIHPLTGADCTAMAQLHVEGFSRPWSDGEFHALLSQGPVFGFIARRQRASGRPAGFILARLAAGEAEILTVVTGRHARRSGLGHRLVAAVLRHLHHVRAETVFLEVDEANAAAIALYKGFGFLEVARRPAYYDTHAGKDTPAGKGTPAGKSAALVMRLDLK